MRSKKLWKVLLAAVSLAVFSYFTLIHVSLTHAQDYWTALPPYNTLWPLWSTALSPVNATTGLPTPVVTSLAASTVLPVEPGLTWDPGLEYPWLLYNTPVGMAYFDPLYGVNFWPASNLLDSAGAPLPIALPDLYSTLPPTDPLWVQQNVLFANYYFLQSYPSLLLAADPTALIGASTVALPPSIVGALTLGLPIPTTTLTTIFPPLAIDAFLTPAALLGL
jgi:hypothetical protein